MIGSAPAPADAPVDVPEGLVPGLHVASVPLSSSLLVAP